MLGTNTQRVTGTGRMSQEMRRAVSFLGPRAQHRANRTWIAITTTVVILSLLATVGRSIAGHCASSGASDSITDTRSGVDLP